MYKIYNSISCLALMLLLCSCGGHSENNDGEEIREGTPITVAFVNRGTLKETISLNATSVFQLKTPVKSVAIGYLHNIKIKQGDFVKKGDVLMSIITKEAKILGNTINKLDTSFHFNSEIIISASGNGFISQLNFQNGDYVQDGEQVAVISDASSFAFLLDIPYELSSLLQTNKKVLLLLPDSTQLTGTIEKPLPVVDAVSQTQSYLVKIESSKIIPENLIAKVLLVKSHKEHATSILKEGVLADEAQSVFWVMKLINDSTAVKVIIKKGIESDNYVEILSPQFSDSDKIIIDGNYGLPDTAKVYISN